MLVINILAGKLLGVEKFGKFGLLSALGTTFFIFMTVGIDSASTHFIAREDNAGKKEVIQSSGWMIMASVGIVSLVVLALAPVLETYFFIDRIIIQMAVVFGAIYAIRNLLDSFAKGLHLFKFQALLRIGEAVCIGVTFCIFFYVLNRESYLAYAGVIMGGYLVTILCFSLVMKTYLGFRMGYSSRLFRYGIFAFFGGM